MTTRSSDTGTLMTSQPQTAPVPQLREVKEPASTLEAAPPSKRRRVMAILVLGVAVAAAIVVWRQLVAAPVSDAVITLSGRIEGDDADGRAETRRAHPRGPCARRRHGQRGRCRSPCWTTTRCARARSRRARRWCRRRRARAPARDQMAVLQEQLRRRSCTRSSRKWMRPAACSRRKRTWPAPRRSSRSSRRRISWRVFDKDAYQKLAQTGAVSERQAKVAVSTADQQAAALIAAERRVEAAQGALTTAKANLTNPDIREAETATVGKQLAQQESRGRERRRR